MDTKANPMSRSEIQKLALEIRKIANTGEHLPFPILRFLEGFQEPLEIDIYVLPDSELDNCYAKTNSSLSEIQISESTYDGAANGNPRDTFTLAHEFGHYLMHTPSRISFARGTFIKAYENPEWQANTFAGELLAPSKYIKKELSDEQIASQYGVSLSVARIQKSHAKY